MNHHTGFDPILIRERNQQIRDEVDSLRLERLLRKGRTPRGSQPVASLGWRIARLAGRPTGRV